MRDKEVSLICDKGKDSSNDTSFVKLLFWYNKDQKSVKILCFGIENYGNKSDDAGKAINHTLKLFEQATNRELTIWASTTDAGEGGFGKSFLKEISELG